MAIDLTINLQSVFLAIITIIFIPLAKVLINTLLTLKEAVNNLIVKMGNGDPPSGVLGDIAILKQELSPLRDWAIKQGYNRRNQ